MLYDLAELKETDLGKVEGYEVSADGKKMLVQKDGAYGIIDLPKAPIKLETKLDLSGMEVALDLRQEWDQIYEECWRQMKEFFYAPNMHGVDWEALRLRYKPLAAAVNHRADLTYVIGELIGELSAGHTYVGGGDMPAAPKVKVGMLGAKLERDAKTGAYRIAQYPQGPELGPGAALAPDRGRRQRPGRGVHRRRRRPAARRVDRHLRGPLQQGRPAGHPQGRGRRPTARAAATSSSSPSRPRTPSITTTGSRATSPRSTRPRAARSATSTSRTWASTASTSSSSISIPSCARRP